MSLLSGWRAALRIARRDALRSKGRSALVVAMIALPVLGVTAADVTYRSSTPSKAEQLTAQLGSADALFSSAGIGPVEVEQMPNATNWGALDDSPAEPYAAAADADSAPVDVPGTLPEGARYITEQGVPATVTTRHGIITTDIVELRTADPLVRGKVELTKGSYPDGKDQVVATEHFLKSTGLHVGSRTTLRGPEQTYTITGSVELPADLWREALYADPGAVIAPWQAASDRDKKVVPPQVGDMTWLVEGPAGVGVPWSDVLTANKKGVLVLSRQVVLDPPPDSEIPRAAHAGQSFEPIELELSAALVTVIAMAVLEIVLLAGPAFAVGARRSRRQLGLVGTCGGDRSQVRAVVLAGGVVLGGVGATAGVAAGIGLTAAFRPLIESWSGIRFGALDIRPPELLAIAAIGLVTGVLAALAPAIVAGRQSVLESLTGRRGTRRSSRVLPLLGCVALVSGVAIAVLGGTSGDTAMIAGGSVVAELGLLACVPVIVGFLGRLGTRLPLSPRMALRDAARNRGRTAPAVAAVMAAVAGTMAIATYTTSVSAEHDYDYIPMLTPGTVALVLSDASGVDQLPLARAATERNLAVTGARADFGRVWAGSDCSVYFEKENDCGSLDMVKPKGESHRCPLQGAGAKKLAETLSADEHKRLMRSPACTDEYLDMSAFDTGSSKIVVGGAEVLTSYVRLDDPAAAEALAAGTPVLLNSAYAENGEVTLKAVHRYSDQDKKNRKPHPGKAEVTTDRLKVYVAPAKYAATPGIRMIMPQKTADRLGLHTAPYGSLYTVAHTPTDAETQAVSASFTQAGGRFYLQAEHGGAAREDVVLLILALFAGIVTLGAAAITTGLAKADAEADLTTLSAVGAPPRLRRTLSGFQCVVVALTGVLLGTVAGVVPAVALRLVDLSKAMEAMREQPMDSAYTPIVLPWETLGLLAVVVPVTAGLLAALFAGSRLTLTRRAG
ncbi:putative ABC transport system permease protein [Streptomyces sp. BpilaLS-43]|uniref:FtsX-like permease family protein n=1 Tax=Streptomyces sp. BpilaLS-43 TaxID=1839778 RepID=UPI00081B1F24|nr:FtsX-like permease family protein [Streptomyces sp. BpilaLS-43]SCD31498.1 putative ABC transport system permease protein [Streptomyces sp. BpilaLS-43]